MNEDEKENIMRIVLIILGCIMVCFDHEFIGGLIILTAFGFFS